MKMPSFEVSAVSDGRSALESESESESESHLRTPALLNVFRPVITGMQAFAALATIEALSCFSSPGSTDVLPVVIGESADAIWLTFLGTGIYGEAIAAIMIRVYALLDSAAISATYEDRTMLKQDVSGVHLPALAITTVGINTESLSPEQESALTRALREVARFVCNTNAAFVWSTNDTEGAHHAQMAVVSNAGSRRAVLTITDPHGCAAGSCTTQIPHMPRTRLSQLLLQLGMSFRLEVSPRLQSQEESCVPWAVALVLARSIRPATRKHQMWLVSLVAVLYKLFTCIEREHPPSNRQSPSRPKTKRLSQSQSSESSKSSKSSKSAVVDGASGLSTITTTVSTESTESTVSTESSSQSSVGRSATAPPSGSVVSVSARTTTTEKSTASFTSVTAHTTVVVLSSGAESECDSDSDPDSDCAGSRSEPRVTKYGLDESGGMFVWRN